MNLSSLFELGGVFDHLLDLGGRQLADGVGDCDVGAAAGGLLGCGYFENAVDVDFEDDFEGGVSCFHSWYWRQGKLPQRGVILAVRPFPLENRELYCLLIVHDRGEGSIECVSMPMVANEMLMKITKG